MQVDVKRFRRPTLLLQWMGMNALIIYALAACELFPAAVQGFYWRSPENNLVFFLLTHAKQITVMGSVIWDTPSVSQFMSFRSLYYVFFRVIVFWTSA